MYKEILPELAAEPKTKGKLDQAFIDARLDDSNWIAEEKFDGARYLAHFEADRVYFTSRRTSDVTGKQVEKGLNLPHLNVAVPDLTGTVLDGEVTIGRTSSNVTSIMGALPPKAIARQEAGGWCTYQAWDILYYKGEDVRSKPLHVRKAVLAEAIRAWKRFNLTKPVLVDQKDKAGEYIKLVEYSTDNKRKMLERIWSEGGEGLVLKNLDSLYVEDARDKNAWIKIKQHLSWDVVIMGFTMPEPKSINSKGEEIDNRFYTNKWISAIVFGQYKDGKLVELGQSSGLSDELRALVTLTQAKLIGTVMEVMGQEQIPESGAIRHPRIIRLRDDKDPKDCKLNLKA